MMVFEARDDPSRIVHLRAEELDDSGVLWIHYGIYGSDRTFVKTSEDFHQTFKVKRMSVHFDFVVCDVDAENIMDIMRSAITRNSVAMLKAIQKGDNDSILFLERDTSYIESLIAKMKNTRIDDGDQAQ